MKSPLAMYEKMSDASQRMVSAAQANNWDLLGEIEREVASMRDELIARDRSNPLGTAMLSEAERRHKAELIKKMLANDREIRRHTEPWMDSVKKMLGGASRSRAMRTAYSAVAE